MQSRTRQAGISIVEAIIGISIFALVVIFISQVITLYLETVSDTQMRTTATYLAVEGQEMLRFTRDQDWGNISGLSTGVTHYLALSSSTIGTTATPEVVSGTYRRSFVVQNVYRDTNDNIVASTTSGATKDDGSRLVTVSVGYGKGTTSLTALLTNIFKD